MASFSTRNGKTTAQVRINQGGVTIFSKSKTFATEALAKSWAKRLEDQIDREGIPQARTAQTKTVGWLIEEHLKYQRKLRPLGRATVHNHEQMSHEFRDLLIADLTAKRLIDFATRRRTQDGVTPATILANLSAVSAAMHSAKTLHGIDVNTTELDTAMRRLKDSGVATKSRQVDRVMTAEEESALLEAFERKRMHHQTTIDMVPIFKLATALPRRAGELMRMRWEDVNEAKRTVIIRDVKHPQRKMGNDQVVPLLGDAWAILQTVPRVDPVIFPHSCESMLASFERIRDRIAATGMPGIADLRFHDLRHTGITRLFRLGLSIQEVAVVSGHTNWAQLRRYTHIRPEDLHERLAQLQGADAAAGKAITP